MRIAHVQVIGSELAIAWDGGGESFIPLEALRRACPCAGCQGEPDALGRVVRPDVTHSPSSFQIRSVQPVGGYALQPTWEDGHNTGLFSFSLLQRLGDAAPILSPR